MKYIESDLGQIKFRGKYRVPSARLKNWDYGNNGCYFVTICTKNREFYLGDIRNEKMQLSVVGKMANQCWQAIPKHFPFVALDESVLMPNHIHGILVIDNHLVETQNGKIVETQNGKIVETQNGKNVETQDFASLQSKQSKQSKQSGNRFGPQSRNLASIIRGFKIGVTKFANRENIIFGWQPRYYDHIIRSEKSLNRIRQYIIENPLKWTEDRNNPGNLYM